MVFMETSSIHSCAHLTPKCLALRKVAAIAKTENGGRCNSIMLQA